MHRRSIARAVVFASLLLISPLHARDRSAGRGPIVELPPRDQFSLANYEVHTDHLTLDLTVDFAANVVRGSATHQISNPLGRRDFVVDTRDLQVSSVKVDGLAAAWHFDPTTDYGRALHVDVTPESREVRIDYVSSPGASAMHWLTAKQTEGRVKPFVWVQGEPDQTRGWIPIQDSPGIRMTWSATLHVPNGMMAVMSAPNPTEVSSDGTYRFEQHHSVPAYLIVFAAGRLATRSLGPRTAVYSEPEVVDDAAYEMQRTPEMLLAAEQILGPYPWDRYDLLFPPKFGGGMENPNLNFLGPDLISGNHPAHPAVINTIAHEMAHSWTGDLVTCATWSDTWLNEGFASYLSTRITEAMGEGELSEYVFATDRAAFKQFQTYNPAPRLTVLHRDFVDTERPSNAFNIIAYQKGEFFLKMLEDRLGRARFDQVLRSYLDSHRYHWVDDRAFLGALMPALQDLTPAEESDLRVNDWVYGSGLPDNVTAPATSRLMDRVKIQSDAFRAGTPAAQLDRTGWAEVDENIFLNNISDLIPQHLAELDETFGFSARHTPPIRWLLSIYLAFDTQRLPVLEAYMMRGTVNSLAIWYQMGTTVQGRQYGVPLYQRVRDYYDYNSQNYIEVALHMKRGFKEEVPVVFRKPV